MEKGYATIREVAEYFGVTVSTVRFKDSKSFKRVF
jgi:DNA-binding transcriptional MerR regulator